MDLSLKYDNYISLPKDEAYSAYCDDKNKKILNLALWILTAAFGIVFLITAVFDRDENSSAVFYTIIFLLFLLLRIFFKSFFSGDKIRKRVITMFLTFLVLFTFFKVLDELFFDKGSYNIVLKSDEGNIKLEEKGQDSRENKNDSAFLSVAFIFSFLLLFLRLSKNEYIQLYTLSFGLPFIPEILINERVNVSGDIAMSILVLLSFVISITRESKHRKTFENQYDYFVRKDKESVRMKRELDYARQIQISMLPETPAYVGELEIVGFSEPAKEVGGDYFDYFEISKNEVGVFICDVSGHGVASGLLLSGLRSGIHLILEDTVNPKIVIEKLNRMIRKTQSRKMFVTAILAVINTQTNKCSLFNAGHLPPYKIAGGTMEIFKLRRHGITLGAMDEIVSDSLDSELIFDFAPGDKLVLYTDGVNEAMNKFREEYGFERLEQFLYANADKEPSDLINELVKDVNLFTNQKIKNDDLTLLVIKRNPYEKK